MRTSRRADVILHLGAVSSRGRAVRWVVVLTVIVGVAVGAVFGEQVRHHATNRRVGTTLASASMPKLTATRVTLTARPSKNPVLLALAINHAQEIIDNASASSANLLPAARFEQLAFRELVNRRSMRRRTLSRLSPRARSVALASVRAADAISKIVPPETAFPHWRIVAAPPPNVLLKYFKTATATYRIRWQYLAAIEFVETRMGRVRGSSPAGARGPMQFMPATWAEYGRGDINGQRQSIMAAAHFLAANSGHESIGDALFHYNPSRSYVAAIESYAGEMRRDERSFYGYYYWRVLYRTVKGVFVLPVGYPRVRPKQLARIVRGGA